MKKRYGLFTVLLLSAICVWPAGAVTGSWSYEHPKVKSGEFTIHSACMIPAEGKLSKQGVKGREGMAKQSDDWSTALENVVEAHLKSAGVSLMPAISADESGASDDEVRQVVLQIQQKYDEVSAKLNSKPKEIGKSRYTLGDQVALLPCAAKSDVLVFVQGEGQVLTGGKKTMGMLFGGAANSGATLILTMADAKTGEILTFARLVNINSFGGSEQFMDDTDKAYGKALDKQLSKMKIGEKPPK
jgi:lambda repressor-like predicted transcriptional regulator